MSDYMRCRYVVGGEVCGGITVRNGSYCNTHNKTAEAREERKALQHKGSGSGKGGVNQVSNLAKVTDNGTTVDNVLNRVLEELDKIMLFEKEARAQVEDLDGEWRYTDKTGSEQLRAEIGVYERAMDRTSRVLRDVARLDIDSRVAGIERKQAEFMLMLLMRAMDAAGVGKDTANSVIEMVGYEIENNDDKQQ